MNDPKPENTAPSNGNESSIIADGFDHEEAAQPWYYVIALFGVLVALLCRYLF
jgi:hypothetical protein